MKYTQIKVESDGLFKGTRDGDMPFTANFTLFLIQQARDRGCDFEDLADGFGPGMGTLQPDGGSDWSAIRDSTNEACERMLERALNHLFGESHQEMTRILQGIVEATSPIPGTLRERANAVLGGKDQLIDPY